MLRAGPGHRDQQRSLALAAGSKSVDPSANQIVAWEITRASIMTEDGGRELSTDARYFGPAP
jgi:hypothetical protein